MYMFLIHTQTLTYISECFKLKYKKPPSFHCNQGICLELDSVLLSAKIQFFKVIYVMDVLK